MNPGPWTLDWAPSHFEELEPRASNELDEFLAMELEVSFSAFSAVMYALEATITIPPTWANGRNIHVVSDCKVRASVRGRDVGG
jgi:hypothetical protein